MDDDEFLDPGYWRELLGDSSDDVDIPDDPVHLDVAQADRMLRGMRTLQRRVTEYQVLHDAAVRDLEERKAKVLGPVLRRLARLERSLQEFARAAHAAGRGTINTPHGVLKPSRMKVEKLDVDDETLAAWVRPLHPAAVLDKPVVSMRELRAVLDLYETEAGTIAKVIIDREGREIARMKAGERWLLPMPDGCVGRYVETVDDLPEQYVRGVTWSPVGMDGCGFDFTVEAV